MSVTLKDIAKKANVSVSTVSRVVNNDTTKPASKDTSEKIWEIVKELGYIPNQNARNLIKGEINSKKQTKSKAIGCIFTSKKDTYNDPFYSEIASAIQNEVSKRGYIMAYSFSSFDMSFSALYNNITTNPVDGVIVLGRFGRKTLEFLKNNFENLIYAGVNYVDSGFDEVICDGYKGAIDAIEYLIKLGHKDIGFVGEVLEKSEAYVKNEHRFVAYRDAIKKNNISYKKEFVVSTPLEMSTAYDHMKKYLKKQEKKNIPSAFFCSNDVTTIGVMKALKEFGLLIPEDVSVVGLDNIEMSSFVTPSLTTINIPKEELGRTAVKILIDKIESDRKYPLRIDLPFELIVRESSENKD